jgi:hypothetical protein
MLMLTLVPHKERINLLMLPFFVEKATNITLLWNKKYESFTIYLFQINYNQNKLFRDWEYLLYWKKLIVKFTIE